VENEKNELLIFNKKELYELESSGNVRPLSDLYIIEDIAMQLQEIKEQINFYKDYKRKKNKDIRDSINGLEHRVNFFRDVIAKTLEVNDESKLSFPGSCSVSQVKPKPNWVITNESKLIEKLKEEDEFKNVGKVQINETLDKSKVNTLLDIWEQNGKIKEIEDGVVYKDPGAPGVAIRYEEKVNEKEDKKEDDIEFISKDEDYDSL